MIAKLFEIRDARTFIPMLAVRMGKKHDSEFEENDQEEAERYLAARAGFGGSFKAQAEYVMLIEINGGQGKATCDPYDWQDRTRQTAHQYIIEHFDELPNGAVVDAEFLLGLSKEPTKSERCSEIGAIIEEGGS